MHCDVVIIYNMSPSGSFATDSPTKPAGLVGFTQPVDQSGQALRLAVSGRSNVGRLDGFAARLEAPA